MAQFDGKYKLIGTENSYFTIKLRSYMRYKKIPFVEVEASPQVRQSMVGPKTGGGFIPVLICPDDTTVIQDTSEIIDYLEAKHSDPPVYHDRSKFPLKSWANFMIEAFVDEFFIIYAMYYRWSQRHQRSHIYYEFGRTALSGAFPGPGQLQKYLDIGGKMGDSFSAGSLFGQGITSLGNEVVEQHFEKCILEPLTHHLTGTPYLLGNYPELADFAINGGFYGHIYRDPMSSSIVKLKAPPVADWIERTAGMVPARAPEAVRIIGADPASTKTAGKIKYIYSKPPPVGEDVIPPTAVFMFKLAFAEFVPHVIDVCRIVRDAVKKLPEAERLKPLKRTIGGADFYLTNPDDPSKPFKGNRRVYPYAIWMMQRATDCYDSLSLGGKSKVDEFIRSLGDKAVDDWKTVRKEVATMRVKRVDNQVVVDWDKMGGAKL